MRSQPKYIKKKKKRAGQYNGEEVGKSYILRLGITGRIVGERT